MKKKTITSILFFTIIISLLFGKGIYKNQIYSPNSNLNTSSIISSSLHTYNENYNHYDITIDNTSIQNYISSGSGNSWEDPYIINNFTQQFGENQTFKFQKISQYLIIQDIGISYGENPIFYFLNCSNVQIKNYSFRLDNFDYETIFIENSSNISIIDCTFNDIYRSIYITPKTLL